MAYTNDYDTLPGFVANSTGLASSQFSIVKVASTAGQVVLGGTINSTTIGTTIYGVLQNAPAGGEAAEVAFDGLAKLKVATSTIAIGDRIGGNSTSLGTDAGVTDNAPYIARAIEASGAANDIITVLVARGGARY